MRKILILLIVLVSHFSSIYSQPYILNVKSVVDTTDYTIITDSIRTYNITQHLIQRINLLNGQDLEIYEDGVEIKNVIYLKQDSLALIIQNTKWTIYDIVNNQILYNLPHFLSCIYDALIFDSDLYVFECNRFVSGDFHSAVVKINLLNSSMIDVLLFPYYGSHNNLGINYSTNQQIYFEIEDTNYIPLRGDLVKLATFSIANNHITNLTTLAVYGVQGADGYILHTGQKNLGIIESYFNSNQNLISYFNIYDFINNSKSDSIAYSGNGIPYIVANGDYLLIASISDSAGIEFNTGFLSIYDANSTLLLKTIELPHNGIIYQSEIYPNNIYYVKDIQLPTRQIYTLKMDSIFNVLDLTSLSPATKVVNSPPFTLTVNGHGFDTLSTVYFNGGAKTTTYISDSVLTASISTADISVVGNYTVWVTDEWGTSDTLMFAVTPQPADLSSLSPAIALTYDPLYELEYFTITVNGSNFDSSSVIYFGGYARTTTFVSSAVLTFQGRSYDVGVNAHTIPLWVSNGGAISDTLIFSVQTNNALIEPVFSCIVEKGEDEFTAHLGYINSNSAAVFIPIGSKNQFWPSPQDRGQPKIFLPGSNLESFTIDFDGSEISWQFATSEATFSGKSDQCE